MKRYRLLLLALALAPVIAWPAWAQSNWNGLSKLRERAAVQVITRERKPLEGGFQRFTAEDLTVRVDRGFFRSAERSIARSEVLRVNRRSGPRSTLIGLAIGVGAGAAIAAAYSPRIDKSYGGAITKGGLIALTVTTCGATGTMIGFGMRGYGRPVYIAPGADQTIK